MSKKLVLPVVFAAVIAVAGASFAAAPAATKEQRAAAKKECVEAHKNDKKAVKTCVKEKLAAAKAAPAAK